MTADRVPLVHPDRPDVPVMFRPAAAALKRLHGWTDPDTPTPEPTDPPHDPDPETNPDD